MAVFQSLDDAVDRKFIAKSSEGLIEVRWLGKASRAGISLRAVISTRRAMRGVVQGEIVLAARAEQVVMTVRLAQKTASG